MDAHLSPAMSSAPTLTPEEMVARQRRLDDRDTRLLTALTLLSAITAGFGLVLAKQVSQYDGTGKPAAAAVALECTEGEVPSTCPDGQICEAGACVAPGTPTRCERGSLCNGECTCEQPLTCDAQNICTLPRNPAVCTNTDVIAFLDVLRTKCGDAKKCESKDLEKYAINYDDFLTLMMQFPDTMALHFPDGKPSATAARKWPSNAESEHYINRLRENLDDLKAADRILMVGLASRDRRQKDPEANKEITLQRLIATQTLIHRAAASALSPDEAEAINAKISFIKLGDQQSIDARFYNGQFGNRPVAWDAGTETHLRLLVEQGDLSADPDELRWRDRTLNQVVFVIPLPCKTSATPSP